MNVRVKSIVFIDMISPSDTLRFSADRLPMATLRERERSKRFADHTGQKKVGLGVRAILDFRFWIMPPAASCLMVTAHCPLPPSTAFSFLLSAFCLLLHQSRRRESRRRKGCHLVLLYALHTDFVFAETDIANLAKSFRQVSKEGNIRNRQSAASGHRGKSWRSKNRTLGERLPTRYRQRRGAKLQTAGLGAAIPRGTLARAVFLPNRDPGIIRAVEAVGEQKAVPSVQGANKLHVPRGIQKQRSNNP